MKYISVCSGIEAASVAWKPLGWEAVAFSEIESFPCAVLAHHYPSVPNRGDMTKFKEWPDDRPDVLVGGTPCQSFSVAGLRAGLDDPRGQLALVYLAIADRFRPNWLVWENVPGVFSAVTDDAPDELPPSDNVDLVGGQETVVEDEYDCTETHAFACFLAGLSELGYGWAYRILDAQYFGVAQLRRRVFVVGYLGDWRRAAAVLLERESMCGHPAPSREAGKKVADGPAHSLRGRSNATHREDSDNYVTHTHTHGIAHSLNAHGGRFDFESETLTLGYIHPRQVRGSESSNQVGIKPDANVSDAMTSEGPGAVAYRSSGNAGVMKQGDRTAALNCNTDPNQQIIQRGISVRRLTPRECERLQGFPDDYTLIPYRGKFAADGPRYRALGNSMPVPVMAWIGKRIEMLEQESRP